MEILSLYPTLKETIWGGNRLRSDFKMETELKNIAEAWVLSCHEDGESIVSGGEYDGKSLSHVLEKEIGMKALGTNCEGYDKIEDFPILIKLIDADDRLSVQVHPDDEYAAANEKDVRGKTEAWYIIDCDADAELQDEIGKFNLIRMQLTNASQAEEKDDAKIRELNGQLMAVYTSVMGNEHMMAYNVAKTDLEEITNQINGILTMTLNGEDPMTCEPASCSGNCASCGGSCH